MSVPHRSSGAFDVDQAARHGIAVLLAGQVIGGLGLASGVAVGSLVARDLFADPALAGVPFAASVAGTTLAALPLFAYMRRGRRVGLRLGWLLGAAGSGLVAEATMSRSAAVLLLGMLLFGVANTASDAARYAAADLAVRRGRAVGGLVFASTLTAIAGPNLLGPAATLGASFGLPGHAGPFLLSMAVFAGAALVLDRLLRPDPLAIRAGRSAGVPPCAPPGLAMEPPSSTVARGWRLGVAWPQVAGIGSMALANFAMVFAMTAAPATLNDMGFGLTVIGLVVSVHIAAMFAPSPVSGWLSDRLGPNAVIGASAMAFALAGPLIAASASGATTPAMAGMDRAPAAGMPALMAGLVMLGIAWNLAYIGGSAVLGIGDDSAARLRVQAYGEGLRGIGALVGAILAGVVLSRAGMAGVGWVTAAAAAPIGVLVAIAPVRRVLEDGSSRRHGNEARTALLAPHVKEES